VILGMLSGRLGGRLLIALALVGVWLAAMIWVLPGTSVFGPSHDGGTPPAQVIPSQRPAAGPATTGDAPSGGIRSATDTAHPTARPANTHPAAAGSDWLWSDVRTLFLITLAGGLVLLGMRWTARRHRHYVRLRIVPARADQAEPDRIARLLGVWHQVLVQRWYKRLLWGQPSLALEVRTVPDAEGDWSGYLSIVCPFDDVKAIEGSLLACYRDANLVTEEFKPLPHETIFRLKKRGHFVRALRTPAPGDRSTSIDAVLRQMASSGEPVVVQFSLVPTPQWFDRYSRGRFRYEEGSLGDPSQQSRSAVLAAELQGGLQVQHRSLFFTDIRIAASSVDACTAIAGVVRGEAAGENHLVVRHMQPWARGPLYLRRLHAGTGNPLPSWRRGVLSCTELATVWHLPSPGLRTVRVERSPIPRVPAPPDISREPSFALGRDERGLVGIRPEDKSDGLGLIGGQKTGKTSVLCRTVEVDGNDPSCALIVLMPKPGDALKALSMVPANRRVHYLDLEAPEFGINPLLARGEAAMVADKVVEAFRDVNMEGDIRGSSDRYLRQAAQAAIGASRSGAVDGPPTLWHMYRMLLPSEEAFRERVVHAIMPDPRFADTATFFGRELPYDLQNAAGQTTAKLDAPRNKLLRLMVESLDKVLRHPRQVSLEEIVRNREVLVVDGKMGTFGSDNCRVMMQFILNMLYGTLQRQQQLPEEERVRVALKVDEAHLILNESFADALATLRSGGLEVVAAWQYGRQIQDEKIRAGMMSLLRQRCMFSMGESEDAREMSNIAMSVYADMIRPDPDSREHLRVAPDTIFNLPNHFALCSWISRGARAPSFLLQTMPLEYDKTIVEHHLEAQRERGGFVPQTLPDPLPDFDTPSINDLSTEIRPGADGADGVVDNFDAEVAKLLGSAEDGRRNRDESRAEAGGETQPGGESEVRPDGNGEAGGGSAGDGDVGHGPVKGSELTFDAGSTSVHEPDAPATPHQPPSAPLPTSFTELDLDTVRGIIWSDVTPQPPDRRPEPTHRELAILGALSSSRVLFASQIHRRWWSDSSLRAAQQGLNRMLRAGWVRRFKFRLEERGAQQSVYALTREGFELAQGRPGPRGPYIDARANWREPQLTDARRVVRDLHVNGWVFALERVAGRRIDRWRGQRDSRIEPPRRKVRGEWVSLRPQDLVIGSNTRLRGFEGKEFEALTPDATVEFKLAVGDTQIRFDLLVEVDRARSQAASVERLRRYDAMISGWASALDRYKTLGTPPVVVFVCEDEPSRNSLVRVADRTVVVCHAKPGTQEADWRFPARKAMFFAVERDMHEESLQALVLPEHPPELRVRLGGPKAKQCQPRRVNIVEPRLLRRG
jgi:hypothetical protein